MTEPRRELRRVTITTQVAICPARGCEREFKPSRSDQVWCSNACRQVAYRDRHDHQLVTDNSASR